MTAQSYFQERGIPFILHEGQKTGWRTRAKLAVRGEGDEILIGLFKPGTHDVEELLACPDHHPKINEAVKLVKEWMAKCGVSPYYEKDHRGVLRYLQFVVERETGKVQAAFAVTTDRGLKDKFKQLEALSPPDFWHSLWINRHPHPSNTIFSQDWELASGEKWLWEKIHGTSACFLPGSFGQANLEMFEKLLSRLSDFVPQGTRILELYAGIGIIALTQLNKAESIDLCESNPESKHCFDHRQSLYPSEKVHFHLMHSHEASSLLQGKDLLIVDPPRKGLDAATLSMIIEHHPKRLIYISCGFSSFVRDLETLEKEGFTLSHVEGFQFLPGTEHVELLAIFS